jgi:hypothetical protein
MGRISLGGGSYLGIEAVTTIVAIVIVVVALAIAGLLYEKSKKKERCAHKIPAMYVRRSRNRLCQAYQNR